MFHSPLSCVFKLKTVQLHLLAEQLFYNFEYSAYGVLKNYKTTPRSFK